MGINLNINKKFEKKYKKMHQFVFKKKARQLSGLYMVSENLKNHLKTRNQPKTKVVNPIMFCLEWPIYLVLVKKKPK